MHLISYSLICTTHTLWHVRSVTEAQLVLSMVPVIGHIVTSTLQVCYKPFTTHRPMHPSSQTVTTRSRHHRQRLPSGMHAIILVKYHEHGFVLNAVKRPTRCQSTASACGEKAKCPDNALRVPAGTASSSGVSEDFTPRSRPSGKPATVGAFLQAAMGVQREAPQAKVGNSSGAGAGAGKHEPTDREAGRWRPAYHALYSFLHSSPKPSPLKLGLCHFTSGKIFRAFTFSGIFLGSFLKEPFSSFGLHISETQAESKSQRAVWSLLPWAQER